jgi:hypothetical protein
LKKFLLIIILSLPFSAVKSQAVSTEDSVARERAREKNIYGRARTASIMSAVLPGLGQVYNRKYWKVPVIYACLGGLGYWFATNQSDYTYFSDNLTALHDEDPLTVNRSGYESEDLKIKKREARNNRDFAALGLVMVYLLNIIDANVDAHLKTFDVSDNLGLQVRPWVSPDYCLSGGISLTLKFRK